MHKFHTTVPDVHSVRTPTPTSGAVKLSRQAPVPITLPTPTTLSETGLSWEIGYSSRGLGGRGASPICVSEEE